MFQDVLFLTIVIAFYLISIWQYRNPTKATKIFMKKAFLDEPKIDEVMIKRSLIIRGLLFTVVFAIIYFRFYR